MTVHPLVEQMISKAFPGSDHVHLRTAGSEIAAVHLVNPQRMTGLYVVDFSLRKIDLSSCLTSDCVVRVSNRF